MKSMKMFPGYLVSHRPRTRISLQLSSNSHEHPLRPGPLDNNDLEIFALPNEIFCAIFLFARDLSMSEPNILNLKELPTEVKISHVCRLWRSIAINFPVLWNTFRYGLPKSSTINVSGRLDAYLERSDRQLLDFWLNFRGDRHRKHSNNHSEIFRVVLTHVDRWRRFTLLVDVDNRRSIEDYCRDFKDIHPVNLEHFAFCPQVNAWGRQETFFSPKIFKNGAGKLESVRLETNSYGVCLPPLSNLTTLRIERSLSKDAYIKTSTILPLLAIPSLENLSLSGFGYSEDVETTIKKPIVMKNLRDLRCGTGRVVKFLSFIEAPRLHTLTLKDVCFPHLRPNATPVLTTLILCNCSVSWTAFARELSHVGNQIQHLTVSEASEGTFHLHALTEFAEGSWPRLRTLRCNLQTITRMELYTQLAISRLGTENPFSLYVHGNLLSMWEERSPDILSQLRALCDLRSWDDESPLIPRHWPYGDDRADHPYDKADYDYHSFRVFSYH